MQHAIGIEESDGFIQRRQCFVTVRGQCLGNTLQRFEPVLDAPVASPQMLQRPVDSSRSFRLKQPINLDHTFSLLNVEAGPILHGVNTARHAP
jgi:hypothetical protein